MFKIIIQIHQFSSKFYYMLMLHINSYFIKIKHNFYEAETYPEKYCESEMLKKGFF